MMFEGDVPVPHERMPPYVLSKCLSELAVTAVTPLSQVSIYRCADVVPKESRLDEDFREDHWLSIMYSEGQVSWGPVPPGYDVYLTEVDALTAALICLMDGPGGRHHLLGKKYLMSDLREQAEDLVDVDQGQNMARLICGSPPLTQLISSWETRYELDHQKFRWPRLLPGYWRAFSTRSRKGKGTPQ